MRLARSFLAGCAQTKNGRADANLSGALFDRGFEVMRHPHRQNRQHLTNLRYETITQVAKAPKIRPDLLGIVEKRRNAHQACKFQLRKLRDFFSKCAETVYTDASFGFFRCETDFEKNSQFLLHGGLIASAVEALRNREIIDGVHSMKNLCRTRGFVALQMPDEVPRRPEIFELVVLPFPLLHAILPEMAQARFECRPNGFGRMRLGNSNQCDFFGPATGLSRGCGDALANARHIFMHKRLNHFCGFAQ